MERKTDQAGKRELYKDKGVDREANWEWEIESSFFLKEETLWYTDGKYVYIIIAFSEILKVFFKILITLV